MALFALSASIPLAVAALMPAEVAACSPGPPNGPCFYADQWASLAPVNAAAIPIDGVLVLQGAQTGPSPEAEWLDDITFTVTRDGQPVAGALETTGIDDVLIWRPAAPLVPGATYKVQGALDNPDEDPEGEECGPDLLPLVFEFHADAGPAAPLATLTTEPKGKVTITPQIADLDALVCCDDAIPFGTETDDCKYEIKWNQGACASLVGEGRLDVTVTTKGVPASTLAMTSRRLVVEGVPGATFVGADPTLSSLAPVWTQVLVRNLASGETVLSEAQCVGDEVAGSLGEQQIDPSPVLAELCAGPAYECNVQDDVWQPDACSPWPAEMGDTMGTSDTDGDTTSSTGTDGDTTGTTGTAGETTSATESGEDVTGAPTSGTAGTGGVTTGDTGTGGEPTGTTGTGGGPTSETGTPGESTGASGTAGDSDSDAKRGQDETPGSGCACDSGGRPDALVMVAGWMAFARRRRRR
ncbi:hypothetical protein SAMN02745121_06863 [Nannocystis exedens]|uniref:MYXO-CTERM domain-containing protein n=1 Tax=Nannocystis exedens TaxID=54 RepID=A0A1I2FW05_9BACT|nr:hypothetical protein [Nannocystis exedens]PCC73746.1 hypothetical protein NAEX_06834 [Nannocystis exedens]SFF08947.1 hypothetical protein SAMN02745121_06863 [Nannocystis exedens]